MAPVDNNLGVDTGMASNSLQAIIWTNADSIHWRLYATQERDELGLVKMNRFRLLYTQIFRSRTYIALLITERYINLMVDLTPGLPLSL